MPTAKEMRERFSVLSELRLGAGELGDAELAAVSGGVGAKFKNFDVNVGFMNLGASGYILGFSLSNKNIKLIP